MIPPPTSQAASRCFGSARAGKRNGALGRRRSFAYDLAGNRTKLGRAGVFESVFCTYFHYDWTYYEYDSDDSLTKHWRADTGAGTYFHYDKTGSCEKVRCGISHGARLRLTSAAKGPSR